MQGETPFGTYQPISKRKIKPVDCLREGIRKSILKAKKDHKKSKATRALPSKKV